MKVYKVSAKKNVEELCLMILKNHSVHLPPIFWRGVEPPTKFSQTVGLDRTSTFRGALLGERGMTFFKKGGSIFA